MGWRDVPHDNSKIGEVAKSVVPELKQIFIARGKKTSKELFEKKLYIIRKKI